jgi:hypothetical protein
MVMHLTYCSTTRWGSVAMMGKTFMDEMEDTHRIWVFPFASMVLRYEKMLDKRQRIKYRHGREARSVTPCIQLCNIPFVAFNLHIIA